MHQKNLHFGWVVLALALVRSSALIAGNLTPPFNDRSTLAIAKLRQFCGACHGLGSQRFLFSDDQQTWTGLFNNQAPVSRELWVLRIRLVLDWPGGTPPGADSMMDPGNHRDWMPKGAKRLDLAADKVDDQPSREFLREVLQNGIDFLGDGD